MHRLGDTGAPFYIGKGYRVDYGKYLRATDYCRRRRVTASKKLTESYYRNHKKENIRSGVW
jgi:hypothetical protein